MGYPHPDVLLRKLSSKQVAEWTAYDSLEPFGESHRDWHFGQIITMMINMFGGKQPKSYEPEDFVKPNRLTYERRKQQGVVKQSGEGMKEVFRTLKQMQKQEKREAAKAAKPRKKKHG